VTALQPDIDASVILKSERDKAMRVREAMLAWLRAFEEMHDLPRTPTSRERGEHRVKRDE